MDSSSQRRKNTTSSIGEQYPGIGEALEIHDAYTDARAKYTRWEFGNETYHSSATDTDGRHKKLQFRVNVSTRYNRTGVRDEQDRERCRDRQPDDGTGRDGGPNVFAAHYSNSSVWETFGIDKNDEERMTTEWDFWEHLFGTGITEWQTDHDFVGQSGDWWSGGANRNERTRSVADGSTRGPRWGTTGSG